MATFINSRSLLVEIDDEAAEMEDTTGETGQDYADDDSDDTDTDYYEWFTDLLKKPRE